MKHILIGLAIMMIPSGRCFAADPMEESAAQLAIALNISTNSHTMLTNAPVFSGRQIVTAGGLQLKQTKIRKSQPELHMDIEIVNTNSNILATGRVIECASFDAAQKALLRELVMNSMPIEALARKYEVRHNGVGELCIGEKMYDEASGTIVPNPSVVHFVRAGTAITIRTKDKSRAACDVARAIDKGLADRANEQGGR